MTGFSYANWGNPIVPYTSGASDAFVAKLRSDYPPTVSITNPTDGATVSGSVSIQVAAFDEIGIKKVDFYIDDVFESTEMESPYEYSWDSTAVSNGSHTIRAVVYDGIDQMTADEISVTVDNKVLAISSTAGGTTDPAPGTHKYGIGTEVNLSAIADLGYAFLSWTGDVPSGHETDNPLTIMMDSDKFITANFTSLPGYMLTISTSLGGTTDPVPGDHSYFGGAEVDVTAIPGTSFSFFRWTGDVPSGHQYVNPLTITMTSNKSITAKFTRPWTRIAWNNSEKIITADIDGLEPEDIVGDFGELGIWFYNGVLWIRSSWANPENIIALNLDGSAHEEIVGDFGSLGIWFYNGVLWSQLCWTNPEDIISANISELGGDEVAGDFGSQGIWYYSGIHWSQYSWSNPESFISANIDGLDLDEIVGDFGASGIWYSKGFLWTQIAWTNPQSIFAADVDGDLVDEIIGDFGLSGIYYYDGHLWTKIAWTDPESLTAGDLDGDGMDEIIGDFGSQGIWAYDNGVWSQIAWNNPEELITADVNGDGLDDVVGDFGALGIWYW